jgi:hypothetical protein
LNKNIKLIFNYWLGPILFVILSVSLYRQIIRQPDLPQRWEQVKASWQQPAFWFIFLLMLVNWGIESRKWQFQIRSLQPLSFFKAFQSVLAGSSITMLTPNRIGEYGGRILFIDPDKRLAAIPLTILGSISQLAITMLAGAVGFFYLRLHASPASEPIEMPWFLNNFFGFMSVASSLLLLLLYFKVPMLTRWVARISFLKSLVKYLGAAEHVSRKLLLRILILSAIRYAVFILQYVWMLDLMNVDLDTLFAVCLLTQFFQVMVLAPTIGFTELPVRATAGTAILSLFSNNLVGIQATIFAIWLINIVVPALLGSVCILGVKLTKDT